MGVFDSGVGGLSVVRALQQLAPGEHLIYFADTAFFPYGPRPAAEVRKRAFAVVNRLLAAQVKAIVVACNTASAAAITDLREAFPVPFIGMVPGLKPAALASRSGRVAILATAGTFDGELYARVASEFGRGTHVVTIPGDGLASIVENGQAGTEAARRAIRAALQREVGAGADTVVLGCTHYHFLAPDIRVEFPRLTIVDTSEAVAHRALDVLRDADIEAPPAQHGALSLIVSGDRERFRDAMSSVGFAPAAAPRAGAEHQESHA